MTTKLVQSLMVELHRFGKGPRPIQEGEKYIRTAGGDSEAVEVTMNLDQYTFLKSLASLRYQENARSDGTEKALQTLSDSAVCILAELPAATDGSLVQIDLVTAAAELWAFPFEACRNGGVPTFANRARPAVLTRRIRGKFADHRSEWPVNPRVLFAHAPAARDLKQSLIDDHIAALREALKPWLRGGAGDEDLLTVREAYDAVDLQPPKNKAPFTHVHLLAHGVPIPDPVVPQLVRWGLRLGTEHSEPVPPEVLARSLAPIDGLPVVVTIAACDAANQGDPGLPTRSFAQELHAAGIPVVVASQLPLTMEGSVQLARSFYDVLLRGEDVRLALYEARTSLFELASAGHDWLSIVAYVRLPEGYAEYLMEMGLRYGASHARRRPAQGRQIEHRKCQRCEVRRGGESCAGADNFVGETARDARSQERGRSKNARGCSPARINVSRSYCSCAGDKRPRHPAPTGRRLVWRSKVPWSTTAGRFTRTFIITGLVCSNWQLRPRCSAPSETRGTGGQLSGRQNSNRDRDAADCWACGSLAEAHLLAPLAGEPRNVAAAAHALGLLKERAATSLVPVTVTRRQLTRYVTWWTNGNGFFPGQSDLQEDATLLLQSLD